MKSIKFLLLLLLPLVSSAQYTKEKLTTILTGGTEKTWNVTSVNMAAKEKMFSFNKNLSVVVQDASGTKRNDKWLLSTTDNIRWFIMIGKEKYEMIVSYDKKGEEYIKLTHQSGTAKAAGDYEIKLTAAK